MNINHNDAIVLENVVSNALQCERYGIGGLVDADLYEDNPLEAVILCVSKLYRGYCDTEIAEFFSKWRTVFKYPEDNAEFTFNEFVHEFSALIALMKP